MAISCSKPPPRCYDPLNRPGSKVRSNGIHTRYVFRCTQSSFRGFQMHTCMALIGALDWTSDYWCTPIPRAAKQARPPRHNLPDQHPRDPRPTMAEEKKVRHVRDARGARDECGVRGARFVRYMYLRRHGTYLFPLATRFPHPPPTTQNDDPELDTPKVKAKSMRMRVSGVHDDTALNDLQTGAGNKVRVALIPVLATVAHYFPSRPRWPPRHRQRTTNSRSRTSGSGGLRRFRLTNAAPHPPALSIHALTPPPPPPPDACQEDLDREHDLDRAAEPVCPRRRGGPGRRQDLRAREDRGRCLDPPPHAALPDRPLRLRRSYS